MQIAACAVEWNLPHLPLFSAASTLRTEQPRHECSILSEDVRCGRSGDSLHGLVLRKHISHAGTERLVTGRVSHHWVLHCWWQAAVKEAPASCLWSSHGGDSRLQTDRWATILWSLTGQPQRCFTPPPPHSLILYLYLCECVYCDGVCSYRAAVRSQTDSSPAPASFWLHIQLHSPWLTKQQLFFCLRS